MPPWARQLDDEARGALVTSATEAPSAADVRAAVRPARPEPTTRRSTRCSSTRALRLLVYDHEAKTLETSLAEFATRKRKHGPGSAHARHARRRPAGARRPPAGAALGACDRALRRAAGRFRAATSSRARRSSDSIRRHLAVKVDVRELSHLEQLETLCEPGRDPSEWQLATTYLGLVPADVDPALPDGHPLAPRRGDSRACVRPPRHRPRRQRASACEALVHEHRLRAGAGRVHDLRAPRALRRRARARGLRHEPAARSRAAPHARADRRAARAGTCRRPAGGPVPLRRAPARGHRPVRGAAPARARLEGYFQRRCAPVSSLR